MADKRSATLALQHLLHLMCCMGGTLTGGCYRICLFGSFFAFLPAVLVSSTQHGQYRGHTQRNLHWAARSKGEQEERKVITISFRWKKRGICGTLLSSKRQDLALIDLCCVAANAAPTVTGKTVPSLLQQRGRPAPGSVELSIFPLEWGGSEESERQFAAALLTCSLTTENQHHQQLLL